ncbi:hypothetical protein FOA43_001699 [Brettanomyces nanus]|uniref:Uncharacterized protein n=1 Tax=Eeniella nana TaxID=13502 RepID=A0A875S2S4_EENNA|nr:uncharacterized protein FOA43_001699 [Brettanomyces nanus]QPG74372.1 hypothetical protein FOA43_001699 [Brettanomyces nanus]
MLLLAKPFLSTAFIVARRSVSSSFRPSISPIHSALQFSFPRFQSNLQKRDPEHNKHISADAFEKKEVIKRRIPGERVQGNTLQDRFPSTWKFDLEAMPTLLPRPGVPEPNRYPLAKMYQFLKSKKEPELIYEAEPHKLYFVFCYAFAIVFIVYSVNALVIGRQLTDRMYADNEMNLENWKLDLEYIMHGVIVMVLGLLPLSVGFGFLWLPTRLIRRIWYLPAGAGRGAYIRFTTHPLLPNRPTPIRIMPLGSLQKSITARIYSGKGFYGVNDSSFFFFLRESGKKLPFIVDRKGFFWGDGRIFDLIFSNSSIDEVESSKKIDEVYGDMLKERRAKQQELRKQYGFGWRTKAAGKLMLNDISKIKSILGEDGKTPVKKEEPKKPEKSEETEEPKNT